MKKIIITSSLATIVIAIALVALRPLIVQAITTQELERVSSAALNTINNKRCGLADVKTITTKVQNAFTKQYIREMLHQFTDPAVIGPYIACIVNPSGKTVAGTGNTSTACQTSFGGYAEAIAKSTVLNKLKSDFLSNCVARFVMDNAFEKAQRVMNENGRDGGALAVQDWSYFFGQSRDRGVRIDRNDKAHVHYCPWVQKGMEDIYGLSPQNATDPSTSSDTTGSQNTEGACPLSATTDPSNLTAEQVAQLYLPAGTLWGSFVIGEDYMRSQVAMQVEADTAEFVPTGGLGGIRDQDPDTNSSCVKPDPTNPKKCLKWGPMVQSAAAVQAEVQAERQANWDWITNARQSGTILGDVQNQIISSLLSSTRKALDVEFGLDAGQQDIVDTADAATTAEPCSDLTSNPDAQTLASSMVLEAQQAVIINHPEFTDGTSTSDSAAFLDAVCNDTIIYSNGSCSPSANGTSVIISIGSIAIQVDIITPSGIIRLPGEVVQACTTGTL